MEAMIKTAQRLVEQAIECLERHDPEAAKSLQSEFDRLAGIAQMAKRFPPLLNGKNGGKDAFSPDKLVKVLCSIDSGMSSLNMPVRAVMGSAFLTGKVQLFNALHENLEKHAHDDHKELARSVERQLEKSIYTMLLASLLWDVARNHDNSFAVRERAATELVRLWENPERLTIGDFFPVLEAVWTARNKVEVKYGALMGVSEFFQLVRQSCPVLFLSFFTREDISDEEREAFREFLFGIPSEELDRLKRAMSERGVNTADPKFASSALRLSGAAVQTAGTPQALYAAHRRRQRAAELRRLTGFPGPKNTAEGYLLLHFLARSANSPGKPEKSNVA